MDPEDWLWFDQFVVETSSGGSKERKFSSSRWPRLDERVSQDLAKLRIDPKQIALSGRGNIRDLFCENAVYEAIEGEWGAYDFKLLNHHGVYDRMHIRALHVTGRGSFLLEKDGNFDLHLLYGKSQIWGPLHLTIDLPKSYYVTQDGVERVDISGFVNDQLSKLKKYLRNGRKI